MMFYSILAGCRVRLVRVDGSSREQVVGDPGYMFTSDDLVHDESPLREHVGEGELGFVLGNGFGSHEGGCLVAREAEVTKS